MCGECASQEWSEDTSDTKNCAKYSLEYRSLVEGYGHNHDVDSAAQYSSSSQTSYVHVSMRESVETGRHSLPIARPIMKAVELGAAPQMVDC